MPNDSYLMQEEAYLFNIGEMYHSYLKLGAHIIEYDAIRGTNFAVWVPEVLKVYLWIWTLFVPVVLEKQLYKYEILRTKKCF